MRCVTLVIPADICKMPTVVTTYGAMLPTPCLLAHTAGPITDSGAKTVKQGTRNPATTATLM
jgi:hypothetical protein